MLTNSIFVMIALGAVSVLATPVPAQSASKSPTISNLVHPSSWYLATAMDNDATVPERSGDAHLVTVHSFVDSSSAKLYMDVPSPSQHPPEGTTHPPHTVHGKWYQLEPQQGMEHSTENTRTLKIQIYNARSKTPGSPSTPVLYAFEPRSGPH